MELEKDQFRFIKDDKLRKYLVELFQNFSIFKGASVIEVQNFKDACN